MSRVFHEERAPGQRRWDRLNLLGDLLAIACMIAFAVFLYAEVQRIGRDEARRVSDLRASCLRASIRGAADVNQNWIYYLSERQLAGSPRSERRFRRQLGQLTAGERRFLLALSTGNPSRRILQVRAQVDYQAAHAKALAIDFHDATLVHVRTRLGSGQTPRQWVLRAHFSCARAYG